LARLLRPLLDRDIGQDDNFFDLGLNSVSLLQLHRLVQCDLGVELPIGTLFRHTTVRTLAAFLERDETGAQPPADRGRVDLERLGAAAEARRDIRRRINRDDWGNGERTVRTDRDRGPRRSVPGRT
jgi:acyl carrier protein